MPVPNDSPQPRRRVQQRKEIALEALRRFHADHPPGYKASVRGLVKDGYLPDRTYGSTLWGLYREGKVDGHYTFDNAVNNPMLWWLP